MRSLPSTEDRPVKRRFVQGLVDRRWGVRVVFLGCRETRVTRTCEDHETCSIKETNLTTRERRERPLGDTSGVPS